MSNSLSGHGINRIIRTKILSSILVALVLCGCATEPDTNGNYTVFIRNETDLKLKYSFEQGFAGEVRTKSETIFPHTSTSCEIQGGIRVEYDGIHALAPEGCIVGSCEITIDSSAIKLTQQPQSNLK